jgi:hypothetical protein
LRGWLFCKGAVLALVCCLTLGGSVRGKKGAEMIGARLTVRSRAASGTEVELLDPGAFSLDARLFGRRKVIIPHATTRG